MGLVMMGGGGGKRTMDFDINLVPFIDFLAVCICFLIATAVWVQVKRIDVDTGRSGAKGESKAPADAIIAIDIREGGFEIKVASTKVLEGQPVPEEKKHDVINKAGEYDYDELVAKLKEMRALYPQKGDILVRSMDKISYGTLVRTMDACISNEFKQISIGAITAQP